MAAMVPCFDVYGTVKGNTVRFARFHSEHGFHEYVKRIRKMHSKDMRITVKSSGCTTCSLFTE